ncbi:MAG: hypothetical protein ACKPHU_33895, partial [Planctomycetaceae bacterium]
DGQRIDVTPKATLSTQSPVFTIDADNYLTPVAAGTGMLKVEAVGLSAEVPVQINSIDPVAVEFAREINPLLSKSGCNQGLCHGSANGKNGFKLSLRGYDSFYDYR